MKRIFLSPIIVLLIIFLFSCSKDSSEIGSLVGNWNVVNDSSLNTDKICTLLLGDSGISSSNYNGEKCAATFNFKSNGVLLTSYFDCIYGYGATYDSANYIVKDNLITISILSQNHNCCSLSYPNPAVTRKYTITRLTANYATFTFQSALPSGMQSEIINLKR